MMTVEGKEEDITSTFTDSLDEDWGREVGAPAAAGVDAGGALEVEAEASAWSAEASAWSALSATTTGVKVSFISGSEGGAFARYQRKYPMTPRHKRRAPPSPTPRPMARVSGEG